MDIKTPGGYRMKKNMKKSINTKFGIAYLDGDGYYHIKSPNGKDKLLHRLIYEEANGKIPEGEIIHHIDGNPLNNNLNNLLMVSRSEHNKIHHTGRVCSEETKNKIRNALKGRKCTPEQIRKNSESQKDKKLSEQHKLNISAPNNTTGYFRVSKVKNKNYKQGFYWVYSYYDENNKPVKISSVDLNKLKNKVLQKDLPWKVIHEVLANETFKLNNMFIEFYNNNKKDINGVNSHMYGKKLSIETRRKISESNKGKVLSEDDKIRLSRIKNTSGYYRVCKEKIKANKEKFLWRYRYYEDGKRKSIRSTSIEKLEQKVCEKGLPWIMFDEPQSEREC